MIDHAQKVESGIPVCSALTKAGRACNSAPIRGTDVCNQHASESVRGARDYGKALAEMAVGDEFGQELIDGKPWSTVIDIHRRAGVLDELRRQLAGQKASNHVTRMPSM